MPEIVIGERPVYRTAPSVIAEVGINHEGDVNNVLQLVDAAGNLWRPARIRELIRLLLSEMFRSTLREKGRLPLFLRGRTNPLASAQKRSCTPVSAAAVVLIAAAVMLATARPAYAYLDPGTGGMLLQLLVGGVASALVVGKLYFSKLKVFFSKYPVDQKRPDGN